ncbi:MATE family efflux transporter [Hungatella hominis]|uniref:MATE family efflux transporter n=1 Tax=Hungatella hominis TaxID=2763050 RepID=UPI001FACB89C|nr:MATE family efflux transporter [Hungatella hominis]
MKLHKEFFHYVIPSMLAFALSGVYAIADGFFVGNALGDSALAAVNIAYPLTAFLQAVGTGIGMAAQSSTPSAPARKIIKGAASISVCLSLC